MSGSPLLNDLKTHLYNSGLFDTYEAHSYTGINDENTLFTEADNWTAFKRDGGSIVDPSYGHPMIRLWMGGKRQGQADRDAVADSVIDYVNANPRYGIVNNIRVESDIKGPFSLSNNRSYYEVFLRLTQARC
jgi:hypothetical protein